MKYKHAMFIYFINNTNNISVMLLVLTHLDVVQVVMLMVVPPTCSGGSASENSPESYNQGIGYGVGDSMMGIKGFAVLEPVEVGVEQECAEGTEDVVKVMKLK